MATTSPFDPDKVDAEFYSKDPNQHGNSDYGRESEGVGVNSFQDGTAGMDMDSENLQITDQTRDANAGVGRFGEPKDENYGSTVEWDVEPDVVNQSGEEGRMMSDEAAQKLSEVAENPSDDALFHRADATYLEEGDNPNEGYDPHNVGYDGKDKSTSQ